MKKTTYKVLQNIKYQGRFLEQGKFLVVPFETREIKLFCDRGWIRKLDEIDSKEVETKNKVKIKNVEDIKPITVTGIQGKKSKKEKGR